MKPSKTTTNAEQLKIQKKVEKLQKELADLQAKMPHQAQHTPNNPRMSQWVLIREYLQTAGGKDTPRNIADALVDAGHDLGKYPLRNVKICITSPFLKDVFKISKDKNGEEIVALVGKSIQYSPLTHRPKR